MLVERASLPFGASDITDDIASAFGIRRSQAQRLQSFYGSASASPRDNNEVIELDPGAPAGAESPRINRAQPVAVIRQRIDAMMGEIGRTLTELHFVGPVGSQGVHVGGGVPPTRSGGGRGGKRGGRS